MKYSASAVPAYGAIYSIWCKLRLIRLPLQTEYNVFFIITVQCIVLCQKYSPPGFRNGHPVLSGPHYTRGSSLVVNFFCLFHRSHLFCLCHWFLKDGIDCDLPWMFTGLSVEDRCLSAHAVRVRLGTSHQLQCADSSCACFNASSYWLRFTDCHPPSTIICLQFHDIFTA